MNRVTLDGLEIQIPPKGERPRFGSQEFPKEPSTAKAASGGVLIREVLMRDARLIILPRDKGKVALRFDIHELRLESAGKDVAMKYSAVLTNPTPPGEIHSTGVFGPWRLASRVIRRSAASTGLTTPILESSRQSPGFCGRRASLKERFPRLPRAGRRQCRIFV